MRVNQFKCFPIVTMVGKIKIVVHDISIFVVAKNNEGGSRAAIVDDWRVTDITLAAISVGTSSGGDLGSFKSALPAESPIPVSKQLLMDVVEGVASLVSSRSSVLSKLKLQSLRIGDKHLLWSSREGSGYSCSYWAARSDYKWIFTYG